MVTITYSVHDAEKKILSSNMGAARGKYLKATTFKINIFSYSI